MRLKWTIVSLSISNQQDNLTGTVHEYGTPEYHTLIPAETRRPGSRAAIVIDVYQVGTVSTACSSIFASILPDTPPHYPSCVTIQSCGFAVPLYSFMTHRTQLDRMAALKEGADRDNALRGQTDPPPNSLRAHWLLHNANSLDGLPALLIAPDAMARVIPQHNFDKNVPRPTLNVIRGYDKNGRGVVVKDRQKALALSFFLGAITATAFAQILGKMNFP